MKDACAREITYLRVHPRLPQREGQTGEGRAVGGQANFLHALQGGDPPADVQDAPADQGLPAGEPNLHAKHLSFRRPS